jgi:hypothetical protein
MLIYEEKVTNGYKVSQLNFENKKQEDMTMKINIPDTLSRKDALQTIKELLHTKIDYITSEEALEIFSKVNELKSFHNISLQDIEKNLLDESSQNDKSELKIFFEKLIDGYNYKSGNNILDNKIYEIVSSELEKNTGICIDNSISIDTNDGLQFGKELFSQKILSDVPFSRCEEFLTDTSLLKIETGDIEVLQEAVTKTVLANHFEELVVYSNERLQLELLQLDHVLPFTNEVATAIKNNLNEQPLVQVENGVEGLFYYGTDLYARLNDSPFLMHFNETKDNWYTVNNDGIKVADIEFDRNLANEIRTGIENYNNLVNELETALEDEYEME